MSVKSCKLIYVGPIPSDRSGIGQDVPAHVKIEYVPDGDDRRHIMMLELSPAQIEQIAKLPDVVKPTTNTALHNKFRDD